VIIVPKNISILLIEDNLGDARILEEMLKDSGEVSWCLNHVSSVKEGWDRLENETIHVILLDLMLPESGGIETFKRIYSHAPDTPIIVMTGLNDEELATSAVRQGAQDYLVKGQVDGNLLVRAIRYAIERKQIEEELKSHRSNLEEIVSERTAELTRMNRQLKEEIREKKKAEEELRIRERELKAKSKNLEEANTALKVLLKMREEDKIKLEQDVLSNVRETVIPFVEKLKQGRFEATELSCLSMIEGNLNNIISPFLRNLTIHHFNLTPRETQIANLVKEGKTTKEIADIINVSTKSVDFHRNNIRIKLGLKNRKANLRSALLSLS